MLIMVLIPAPAFAVAEKLKSAIDARIDKINEMSSTLHMTEHVLTRYQAQVDAGLKRMESREIADMKGELSSIYDSLNERDQDIKRLETDYSSLKAEYERTGNQLSLEDHTSLRDDLEEFRDRLDALQALMDRVRDRLDDLQFRTAEPQ